MVFDHKKIEKKWQAYWDEHNTFYTDIRDFSKPKYYALDMFPYPSGVGLHVGHPEGYTATDIICRKKRMEGYNVLHPMGYDSFGLPAEQYAISTGNNPKDFTNENIKTFTRQLKTLGMSYDWSKEIATSDPSFYKWTQWIFKQLFEDGLAKCVDMPVNWCEELGTVLANDEVIDGKSERGGYPVIRKNMRQWVIDIVAYAEKLLAGLDSVDWPQSTKEMQRNWIGKSIGASVTFKIDGFDESFDVFTTRADTLFGATYCVLAPEHQLVDKITSSTQKEAVEAYKLAAASKSEIERTQLNKDKTGAFTGAYAVNPVNGIKIPIWISDYVLSTYGTGAIMAVPAHDERDYAFAKTFDIEIIPVLEGGDIDKEAFVGDGLHINSDFLNGLGKQEAIDTMIEWLEEHKCGTKKVNYRLREWIFARQRYWGEPIPVITLENQNQISLQDDELPLILPVLEDYSPKKGGASPLERNQAWVNVEVNHMKGKRETSTMPGSAGSSWYFLRYIDPKNENVLADKELLKHWLPVDLYIGGPEHAVGHLLYARMWNNYLYDKGIVPIKEPFQKLVHQGMILGENGIKMGKRYPEFVVDPDDIVEQFGADTLRVYEMFMGPLEASKPWSHAGVEGTRKWLDRVYRLFSEHQNKMVETNNHSLDKVYHATVKKVSSDIETLSLNTAISQMMVFINECYKADELYIEYLKGFVKMFACFAPHLGEELWNCIFHEEESLTYASWPTYDEKMLVEDEVEIIVQVNGKLRAKFMIVNGSSDDAIKEKALTLDAVKTYTNGLEIRNVIVIKNKLVNIVV